jgi:ATP-dependent DNA ligase
MPRPAEPAPANPDDWRPQRFGRGIRNVKDAIVEPSWGGVRVLARFELGRARFFDEDGVDCSEEFGDIAAALADSAQAGELILDGFLTVEPSQPGEGVRTTSVAAPGGGQIMAQMLVGSRMAPKPGTKRRLDTDQPIAFVAVDLLSIDDTRLLDVPLLERKRLLDGAIRVGNRIRITPFIRPPIASFAITWKSLGFEELAYKGPNSRYFPNGQNDDWSIAPVPTR